MCTGIYHLKEHLAWVKDNVTGCKEVPPEVKQQMIKIITEGKGKKWRGYESPIDEEDDQEAEFEAQMERAKIVSIQELNYRQMEIQEMYGRMDGASSSHQPQEHVVPGRGGCGPSLLRSTSSRLRRSFSSRPSSYNFYLQMVASIVEVGPSVKGATAKELAGPHLEAIVHDVDKHITQFKVCWPTTGVTIMTDGWKDKFHRYLVNFLISCSRGIVYHSSIDLSRKIHTGRLICTHLDKIIDEVRPENVVQVVTDNAANYRKAGLVKYCILKSKLIIRFVYNHMYFHALMREHHMREIVKESPTRFAIAFLTIQSILVNSAGLRSMIRSNEYDSDDKPAIEFLFDAMRRAREVIFENNIWNEEILEILDHRWRDQLHQDMHAAWFFLNPHNLYSNATLDDADIMEGIRNCIYKLELDLETQMELFLCLSVSAQWWTIHGIQTKQLQKIAVRILSQTCATSSLYVHYNLKLREKHIRKTPTNYTPINLVTSSGGTANEWVSLRTLLLDQDFLSGAVADMNDNVNVAASNEGDMTMDMDDDYTQDEDEEQDDETVETMENNWQEPLIHECEGAQHDALTALVSLVPVQIASNPKID
ncbi:hypothetical protein AMTRI_Chr10g227420 [Amborella trichopoda]